LDLEFPPITRGLCRQAWKNVSSLLAFQYSTSHSPSRREVMCLTAQSAYTPSWKILLQAAKFPLWGLSVHPEKTLSVREFTWQRSPSFF